MFARNLVHVAGLLDVAASVAERAVAFFVFGVCAVPEFASVEGVCVDVVQCGFEVANVCVCCRVVFATIGYIAGVECIFGGVLAKSQTCRAFAACLVMALALPRYLRGNVFSTVEESSLGVVKNKRATRAGFAFLAAAAVVSGVGVGASVAAPGVAPAFAQAQGVSAASADSAQTSGYEAAVTRERGRVADKIVSLLGDRFTGERDTLAGDVSVLFRGRGWCRVDVW